MINRPLKYAVAIAVLIGLTLVGTMILGRVVAHFGQGADPATALNLVPIVPLDWPVDLTWQEDAADTGRIMEPFTRTQIESSYIRAWLQLNAALEHNETAGLKTYFVGPALDFVTESTEQWHTNDLSAQQAATHHDLELHVYSADGSIVSFTDHSAHTVRLITDADGETIALTETNDAYDVVMFLEDGNWRIRHMVRVTANEPAVSAPTILWETGGLHGINYYPAETPWIDFWQEYDAAVIDQDLALIRSLDLNAVRIFLPFDDEINLDKVINFLDQAAANEIGVMVTLFDFHSDFRPYTWVRTDAYLWEVVPKLAEHPALLMWDMKNEPDLDDDFNGQVLVDAWLAHSIKTLKKYDAKTPVTIGWVRAESGIRLSEWVDVVSFHYYGDAAEFGAAYSALDEQVSQPILLTEFGLTTTGSRFLPLGKTRWDQVEHVASILGQLREMESAGFFVWTLHDFERIPTEVVGRSPYRKALQKGFGVAGKPVAELLAPDADLSDVGIPLWARYQRLYIFVASVILGVAILLRSQEVWLGFLQLVRRYIHNALQKRS